MVIFSVFMSLSCYFFLLDYYISIVIISSLAPHRFVQAEVPRRPQKAGGFRVLGILLVQRYTSIQQS